MPIVVVAGLILPANFSTAALIVLNVGILLIIGGYPLKHLVSMSFVGGVLLATFVMLSLEKPDLFPNRVNTWTSRIENFVNGEKGEEQYQVESAKVAIALGGFLGAGPGKSVQKNHLPQSSSDFIFAIIIEEFGLFGALLVLFLYLVFTVKIVRIASKAKNYFSTLLVLGMGLPIITQAMVNMMVAVGLFPVTGQPLPLISSGGTSILLIGAAIGMILSVSRETNELKEIKEKEEAEINDISNFQSDNLETNEYEIETTV
jgi:cell division protein FtsW